MPIPYPGSTGSFPVTGFGVLSATATSALVNTLTLGTNSSGFPTTPSTVYFRVEATGGICYICPFGGAATAASGIPIAASDTAPLALNLANPNLATLICASTASVSIWW